MNTLLETLQLLAAPYEQQVASLPAFVHIPDEIALLFDDTWIFADDLSEKGLITLDQRKAFEQMDEALDQMSQIQDVWTLSSLESSLEWANVRHLARDILVSFHKPKHPPQLFWVQYVASQFTGASESSEEGE